MSRSRGHRADADSGTCWSSRRSPAGQPWLTTRSHPPCNQFGSRPATAPASRHDGAWPGYQNGAGRDAPGAPAGPGNDCSRASADLAAHDPGHHRADRRARGGDAAGPGGPISTGARPDEARRVPRPARCAGGTMSNATAIGAVTSTLQKLISTRLTEGLPIDVVPAAWNLDACRVTTSPPDKARGQNDEGNQINLFLYQASLGAAWRNARPAGRRETRRARPAAARVDALVHADGVRAGQRRHRRPHLARSGDAGAPRSSGPESGRDPRRTPGQHPWGPDRARPAHLPADLHRRDVEAVDHLSDPVSDLRRPPGVGGPDREPAFEPWRAAGAHAGRGRPWRDVPAGPDAIGPDADERGASNTGTPR